MVTDRDPTETPDVFLTNLGKDLTAIEGVDVQLAEILNKYLLKAHPAQDAVAQAKTAIQTLSIERAKSPGVEDIDD
jgi:hypothetical protein